MAEKCLSFDGTDDYVVTIYAPTYGLTDDFTWECWVKTSQDDTNCHTIIAGRQNLTSATDLMQLYIYSGYLKVIIRDEDGVTSHRLTEDLFVADDNWHYVVFKRDTTADKFYLIVDNGTPKEWTDNSTGNIRLTAEFMFGCEDYGGDKRYDFTGLIDETRVSNIARSATEISAVWNGGNGVQFEVDANTVALWHFNEGADSTAYDETDNDNDGTITGASWADGYVFSPSVTEKIDSDTGSGSELKTLAATLSKSDSGSGLESLLLDAAYILSEAGQGTGAASIILTGADAGNGVETLTNLISALARVETGSGIETVASRCFTHSDSGQGTDDLASLMNSVLSGETASGADTTIALLSALATTENGSGIDGLLGRVLSLIDTGSGLDVATLYKALFAADSGTGIEALATLLALTNSSEAGSGADLLRAKIEHTAGGDIKLPSGGQTSIPSRKVGI